MVFIGKEEKEKKGSIEINILNNNSNNHQTITIFHSIGLKFGKWTDQSLNQLDLTIIQWADQPSINQPTNQSLTQLAK